MWNLVILDTLKSILLSDIRLGRGRRKCCEIQLHNSHCLSANLGMALCVCMYIEKKIRVKQL